MAFIAAGEEGLNLGSSSNFLKWKDNEVKTLCMLTNINPPAGEAPDGRNSVISFNQHELWLDDLEEGKQSPLVPAIGTVDGFRDPGTMLGNKPRFKAMALAVEIKDGKPQGESVWSMTISVFRQLVSTEEAMGDGLQGKIIRVMRKGTGFNTSYTIVPTGKSAKVNGKPETNLMQFIGVDIDMNVASTLERELGREPTKQEIAAREREETIRARMQIIDKFEAVKPELMKHFKMSTWPFDKEPDMESVLVDSDDLATGGVDLSIQDDDNAEEAALNAETKDTSDDVDTGATEAGAKADADDDSEIDLSALESYSEDNAAPSTEESDEIDISL